MTDFGGLPEKAGFAAIELGDSIPSYAPSVGLDLELALSCGKVVGTWPIFSSGDLTLNSVKLTDCVTGSPMLLVILPS